MAVIQDLPTELLAYCISAVPREEMYKCSQPDEYGRDCQTLLAASLVNQLWRRLAQAQLWNDVWLYSKEDAERWMLSVAQEKGLKTGRLTLVNSALLALRRVLKLCQELRDLTLVDLGQCSGFQDAPKNVDLSALCMSNLAGLHTLQLEVTSFSAGPFSFPFCLSSLIYGQAEDAGTLRAGRDFGCPAGVFQQLVGDEDSCLMALDVSRLAPSLRLPSAEIQHTLLAIAPRLQRLALHQISEEFTNEDLANLLQQAQALVHLQVDAGSFTVRAFAESLPLSVQSLHVYDSTFTWHSYDINRFSHTHRYLPLSERLATEPHYSTVAKAKAAFQYLEILKENAKICERRRIHIELIDHY